MSTDNICYSDSDDENIVFDINHHIIDKKDDSTFIIKLTFSQVVAYTTSWCFNRCINEDKVSELYQSLKEGNYMIPFIMQAVYDSKHEDSRKIRLLDGQHRLEAIKRYEQENTDAIQNYVWIFIYKLDHTETMNTRRVLELFKKINNNRQFSEEEIPDTFIMDLVNALCETFVKGISQKIQNSRCNQPRIHKKELNLFLLGHKELLQSGNKPINEIVDNIKRINNRLRIKSYEDMFLPRDRNIVNYGRYTKAVDIKFFLNMEKSKYSPSVWIQFVHRPDEL